MWAHSKQKAFTIVELLIVIVIIAILAAITIVAYNGIQTRAENTKTTNSVSAYARAISIYASNGGNYPVASYTCAGKSVTRCANMQDATGACHGAGGVDGNDTLDNLLASVANSLPEPSKQTMNCGGKPYGGVWYHSGDGKSAMMVMYLKGDQPCPSSLGTWRLSWRAVLDQTTTCSGAFETLT